MTNYKNSSDYLKKTGWTYTTFFLSLKDAKSYIKLKEKEGFLAKFTTAQNNIQKGYTSYECYLKKKEL